MRGPEGEENRTSGCILDVEPQRRIVMTDALSRGWRPTENPFFSAIITMEDTPDGGTRYVAHAIHRTGANRQKHEDMGFFDGWGTVADQLAEYAKGLGA